VQIITYGDAGLSVMVLYVACVLSYGIYVVYFKLCRVEHGRNGMEISCLFNQRENSVIYFNIFS